MQRRNIKDYFSIPFEERPIQRFLPSDIVSEISRYTPYDEYQMLREMLEYIFIDSPSIVDLDAIFPGVVEIYHQYFGRSIEEYLEKIQKSIDNRNNPHNVAYNFLMDLDEYLFGNYPDVSEIVRSAYNNFIIPYLGFLLVENGYLDVESNKSLTKHDLYNIYIDYIKKFVGY